MGTMSHTVERKAIGSAIDIILKKVDGTDREKEFVKLIDYMEHFMDGEGLNIDYDRIRMLLEDENSSLNGYLNRLFDELDPHVVKTTVLNLGFEAMLCGTKKIHRSREKYDCNVPWLILMDPTSACNLHCTGCWAAEYGNRLNLTYDEMSSVVKQGKKLGVYFYMFTGGEPLVRKQDIIRLCREHHECQFLAFTNGTLVDEEFCQEMKEVGNLMLAISIEGTPEVNDLRRGQGVYEKVMSTMDLLRSNGR